jgi:hypothetical protein
LEETWFSCKLMYEMMHCVIWLRFTIVYEEPAASIFQVEVPFFCLTLGGHSLLLNVDIFMSDYVTSFQRIMCVFTTMRTSFLQGLSLVQIT